MLLSIDGTIIFVFLSFLVFVWLMNIVCSKPITRIIQEREKFFEKNKKTVLDAHSKKEEILEGIEKELQGARFEHAKILKEASLQNKALKEKSIQDKKLEISNSIREYEDELSKSAKEAKESLKSEIFTGTKTLVSKILNVNEDEVSIDENKLNEVLK